ncbi:hypothetical protein GCM10011409_18390 [Lentibacillus populi]|uniref:Beta-lactamase-related domain-containing protein n=1 Tax=Lentibacillus populi TaxID=1827502 RepID=A0A9W5TY32_9BACI|nr:serine hydrolase domain-containing protein [Lentibacillus populi]GGB41180.1 hypothetical protein GCM10011409_18390 [Lentibacillus populi]
MGLNNINIKERMEHYNVTGLSMTLIENGQISLVDQYGLLEAETTKSVNSDSIFNACSVSKFVTGMLVMKLTEQGLLDLNEDINKRLKSWKFLIINTLRNLLCHQSGTIDPVDSFTELRSNDGIPSTVELLEGKTSYCKVPIEVRYEPGSDFQYSDAGFCIIQQLIEDVTVRPFEDVINDLIFLPLKMDKSSFPITIQMKKGKTSLVAIIKMEN